MQTFWWRSGDQRYLRMTRFFGYVGGVFGPPLAVEGLAAFFAESTLPRAAASAGFAEERGGLWLSRGRRRLRTRTVLRRRWS
jgi:hypothetical protein